MSLFRMLSRSAAHTVAFLGFFLFFGVILGLVRQVIVLMGGAHWLLGVTVGTIWIALGFSYCFSMWYAMRPSASPALRAYMLIPKDRRGDAPQTHQFPEAPTTAMTCVVVLIAVVSMADISRLLATQGLVSYEGITADAMASSEMFLRFYFWHAVDMIPFVELWQTYDIEQAVRPSDFRARTLVLIFRTGVVGFAMAVVAQFVVYVRATSK